MANRYVEEYMKSNSSSLPQTFDEYSLLSTSAAQRVPIAHVQKLREEHDKKLSDGKLEGGFLGKSIKWD